MTLSGRNIFFRVEILLAGAAFVFTAMMALRVIPACPAIAGEASRRAPDFFQHFLGADPYAPFAALAGAAAYALVSLILIYYFFEKTQAPEILFVTLFALSFSVEGMRIVTLLQEVQVIPALYLLISSRILLFGRFFGLFSLFAASVYAAGLEQQKERNIVFIIAIITLMIALRVPIDVLTWDSSYNMINGYTLMFRMVEIGILLITVISFFISAWSRGAAEYVAIGIGSFLAFLGRNLFLSADTWFSVALGMLLLATGTWFICTRLHKVYLWL
ncbi:MAG: hypothetical protein LBT87_01075 [Treponema sp.]|jgi:hypothetical protein|nr:hypothetical protein [Treponema sp.]